MKNKNDKYVYINTGTGKYYSAEHIVVNSVFDATTFPEETYLKGKHSYNRTKLSDEIKRTRKNKLEKIYGFKNRKCVGI